MNALINLAIKAAKIAGEEILEIKNPLIKTKSDGTLVSSADLKSNEIIFEILKESKIDICSEEQILDYNKRKNAPFWLIDPLDGTNNYLKNKKDFCICISLIDGIRPVLGLIYDVCNKNIYYSANGMKVYKNHDVIYPSKISSNNALISLRDNQNPLNKEIIKRYGYNAKCVGSALKFCALLEGLADIYLRFESLNSWDLAAGDFLINQFGGLMIGLDKEYLNYNNCDFLTKPFIAFSKI